MPLYTVPSDTSWAALAAAKMAHPKVPVYAIIDPANGPGPAADAGYAAGIGKLQLAGVTVIGYVPTGYGARSVATIEADIDRWKSFYPATQGIFFDEMSIRLGDELIYKTVSQYAKSKGMTFTVGNPGVDTKPTFVGTTDVVMIYEGVGVPRDDRALGLAHQLSADELRPLRLRRRDAEPRADQASARLRRLHLRQQRRAAEPVGHRPVVSRAICSPTWSEPRGGRRAIGRGAQPPATSDRDLADGVTGLDQAVRLGDLGQRHAPPDVHAQEDRGRRAARSTSGSRPGCAGSTS